MTNDDLEVVMTFTNLVRSGEYTRLHLLMDELQRRFPEFTREQLNKMSAPAALAFKRAYNDQIPCR